MDYWGGKLGGRGEQHDGVTAWRERSRPNQVQSLVVAVQRSTLPGTADMHWRRANAGETGQPENVLAASEMPGGALASGGRWLPVPEPSATVCPLPVPLSLSRALFCPSLPLPGPCQAGAAGVRCRLNPDTAEQPTFNRQSSTTEPAFANSGRRTPVYRLTSRLFSACSDLVSPSRHLLTAWPTVNLPSWRAPLALSCSVLVLGPAISSASSPIGASNPRTSCL